MLCNYCEKNKATVKDHFFPRVRGGKKENNLIDSCNLCNIRKSGHIFWSINSVREFISRPIDYPHWIEEKIRLHANPGNFSVLRKLFDSSNKNLKKERKMERCWKNKYEKTS